MLAAVSANDVWAVGQTYANQTLIQHWDGTSWSVILSPNPSGVSHLRGVAAVSATDVWAVGYYKSGPYRTLIEHWNGTSWSVVPSPNPGASDNTLHGITAVSANDVWAVGAYRPSGPYQTLIEHWDGTSWSVVSSPNVGPSDNGVYKVSAASANDVWAVGSCNGGSQTLIEHWDGTSWSVVSSPVMPTSVLWDVEVVTANDVWAVGYSGNSALLEHWDGTSWSVVSSPSPCRSNNLWGVAAAATNDVWAVGENYNGAVTQTLVEHYAPIYGTPPTSTPTSTPTPATVIINGHLTWQGVAPANRPSVTGTLQLCMSGSTQTFNFTTDTGGTFTITTVLSAGTYHWWIKGGRHLANSSPTDGPDLVIINGYAMQEFGTQRGGDAVGFSNNTPPNNLVNSTDFTNLLRSFGQSGIRSSDFDYNNVVNSLDFTILKSNFGQAGHDLICPCSP
jgi:hypothetical protein